MQLLRKPTADAPCATTPVFNQEQDFDPNVKIHHSHDEFTEAKGCLTSSQITAVEGERDVQSEAKAENFNFVTTEDKESPSSIQVGQVENRAQTHQIQAQDDVCEVGIREQSNPKCFNKCCNSWPAIIQIKSKLNEEILKLCKACHHRYQLGHFCQVCNQIYSLDTSSHWHQCYTCCSFIHNRCNAFVVSQSGRVYCSGCVVAKTANELPPSLDVVKKKVHVQQIQPKKIKIFRDKKQPYSLLDSFLTSYSYKLGLSEDQITRDLYRLHNKNEASKQKYTKPKNAPKRTSKP